MRGKIAYFEPCVSSVQTQNENIWNFHGLLTLTPLTKLLARQARPGITHDRSGTEAETYSSIPATNQHQLRQKMYQ